MGGPTSSAHARRGRSRPSSHPRGEARPKAAPKPPPGPDPLAAIEAEIEEAEREVARLEEKLAADWEDAETIAAHARAREDLQSLLARWETLLEEVP